MSSRFCTSCGAEIPKGICPKCDTLTWTRKIPLITNYILIRDLFLAFFGGVFLIASFLVLITGDLSLYFLFAIVFVAIFILCLLIMLVLELIYGGGLTTHFIISPEGVGHQAGKEMQALDRLSLFGSAFGGSMKGTSAGLIAISQENNALLWHEVRYIRVYSRLRFIELRSKYLISPVVLYCTEKNFPAVLEKVKQYAPKSASLKIHGIT